MSNPDTLIHQRYPGITPSFGPKGITYAVLCECNRYCISTSWLPEYLAQVSEARLKTDYKVLAGYLLDHGIEVTREGRVLCPNCRRKE